MQGVHAGIADIYAKDCAALWHRPTLIHARWYEIPLLQKVHCYVSSATCQCCFEYYMMSRSADASSVM